MAGVTWKHEMSGEGVAAETECEVMMLAVVIRIRRLRWFREEEALRGICRLKVDEQRRKPKKILIFSIVLVILTLCVKKPSFVPCIQHNSSSFSLDEETLHRFQKSLSFQTISLQNPEEFHKLINFIELSFPRIHSSSRIKRRIFNNQSLVYEISGINVSLKPYLLIGHLDVVPVSYDEWDYFPFNGTISDQFIYGRGSLDAKYIVMGILEALEQVIENNFSLQRGFYLVFGHDEESMGLTGALEIAKMFKRKNIDFEFILDEGSFVMPDIVPGVSGTPVALLFLVMLSWVRLCKVMLEISENITFFDQPRSKQVSVGVTEKGYLTLNVSVTTETGHSSMPPDDSAPTILAKALSKLKGDCHPNLFGQGPETKMFIELAPYLEEEELIDRKKSAEGKTISLGHPGRLDTRGQKSVFYIEWYFQICGFLLDFLEMMSKFVGNEEYFEFTKKKQAYLMKGKSVYSICEMIINKSEDMKLL
ncbi:N-fatty-acyl-amino acid synthase/hydrolase PM20D1.2 [Nymphon striatum]|nr:N-fatty-acyl-amino acid synthase/hydrolase PM20D1.2 [Nymphon striatum]